MGTPSRSNGAASKSDDRLRNIPSIRELGISGDVMNVNRLSSL